MNTGTGRMTAIILEKATPKGCLRVERHEDPSFPGFTLYWDHQQIGIFEYDSVKDAILLHVWTADTESPAMSLTLERRE